MSSSRDSPEHVEVLSSNKSSTPTNNNSETYWYNQLKGEKLTGDKTDDDKVNTSMAESRRVAGIS
jgi:hypothetical protein